LQPNIAQAHRPGFARDQKVVGFALLVSTRFIDRSTGRGRSKSASHHCGFDALDARPKRGFPIKRLSQRCAEQRTSS
jgi:hypothetical protein